MELLGKTLGNYRIDRPLGEGGMGAVYQAYDLSLQRDVAIKLIHPHFARQPDFRERFLQEARVMARMDHPGIVKVFTVNTQGDTFYIVMEYIAGGNLRQLLDKLIRERNWLPVSEAVSLVQQLSQTLEYAHQHKVLHRDIKPANLMLKPEPADGLPFRVILTDLGLAKLLEGQAITQEGTSLGTPAYMSPEQAAGQATDPRSDVYSLGILLYELTVGRLPFPIRTITEAMRYHTKEPPPPPRSIRPDFPLALERVILKTLEKEPDNRYASAAELGAVLAQTQNDSPQLTELDEGQGVSLTTIYQASVVTAPKPGVTSLMTMLDSGSTGDRGVSVFGEVAVPSTTQTRIQVLTKGKKPQVFTLQADTVMVGRDKDNQLVVEDPEVSRRHVQITRDGNGYRVMDLNSTNGTFLKNTRLLPGVQAAWEPQEVLHIGDTWLRLILPITAAPSGSRMASRLSSHSLFTSSGAGLVGVLVTPQKLAVEAGGSVTANISLLNQSPNVDHFSLSLTGLPSSWIDNLTSQVELMPGEQKETPFSLRIPRSPSSRAGPHQLVLRVTSQRDPSQFVEFKLTLTVAAYSQFKAELQPQRLRAGQTGRLTVSNLGNVQENFNVQYWDAGEELSFHPPQLQVRIPPGSATTSEFRAQPRRTRWLGGEKSHAFGAQVNLPQGEPQTLQAELISRGLIPIWVPAIAMLLCLAILGATTWISAQGRSSRLATQTAVAFTSDLDNDGLNFGVEVAYGCDPDNPDSDGDGLLDAEEKSWATDCSVRDSDHDNLSDGEEVHILQTNPMNPDTDGDGIPDNIDPDPGSPPTFTPSPTMTVSSPSPTSTPPSSTNIPLTTVITQKTIDRNSATFTFSGTGAVIFECKLGDNAYTACTSPKSYDSLSDGPYTFEVRAKDTAGNTSSPAMHTWTVDTIAPTVRIISSPDNPSPNASSTFSFSGTDNGTGVAGFECQWDNAGFKPCTSPKSNILADGSHTFEVRAKDTAGNISTPLKYTWTVEAAPPSVKAISLPDSIPPTADSLIYTVTFSEPVSGVDLEDFVLDKSDENIDAEILNVEGSGASYSVAVNIISGEGTIRLDLHDDDTIVDNGNRKLGGEDPGNGDFKGQEHTVDKPPPSNPAEQGTASLTPFYPPGFSFCAGMRILKALEKEPDKRYPSAAELGTILAKTKNDFPEISDLNSGQGVSLTTIYQASVDGLSR